MSQLHSRLFSTAAMDAAWSDDARLAAMLRFEAALAEAEADAGLISRAAAAAIAAACSAERFNLDAIAEATALAGNPAIPLVKALTAQVADSEAARHVHRGATSQDVIDTATVLMAREAIDQLHAARSRLEVALINLAQDHRHSAMPGRTLLQMASPITLGLKAAGWLDSVRHAGWTLTIAEQDVLRLQFGGAAGTLGALGDHGPVVAEALAERLDLTLSPPWHARRERIAQLGAALGILIGVLGKIARDISLLMQTEVAEAFEPAAEGKGGSSAMPHKRNPVACVVALAAAQRAPGLVATLLTLLPQEHERAVGGWHAEWETLPELFRLAAGSLHHIAECCEGLEVDTERMRQNLAAMGGVAVSEAAAAALSERLGRADAASVVEAVARRAATGDVTLREALAASPSVTAAFSPEEITALTDPDRALGSTQHFIDRLLSDD